MSKEYYSASQLAGLPGMPRSAKGVSFRAKAQGWPCRPRRARGGGSEYHFSALPEETRAALLILRPLPEMVATAQALADQLSDALGLLARAVEK